MLSNRQLLAVVLAGLGIAVMTVGVVWGLLEWRLGPLKAKIKMQDQLIGIVRAEFTTHKLAVKVALAVQTRKLLGQPEEAVDAVTEEKGAAPDPSRAAGDTAAKES